MKELQELRARVLAYGFCEEDEQAILMIIDREIEVTRELLEEDE